jgi:single-strand DNA-binding protein
MLIGNLGADPEMRFTANGSAVTNFRLAVGRTYRTAEGERRDETEWFSVVTWNKLAEQVGQHMRKGRKVYVEGRLATRSWDGQDGQKHYRTEVIANQVLYLDPAGGGAAPLHDDEPPGGDIDPEDLPFE